MVKKIAFDIDGMLTTEAGITAFNRFKNRDDISVGVITARSPQNAQEFINKNNLQPDFVKTGRFKGRIMRNMVSEGVYYGSNVLDRVMTKVSGWEYRTF